MESPATHKQPREIAAKPKAYAFERSLGIPPAEACRRAGGKVEHGQATKWERSAGVIAWMGYYRSLGQTEEMLAAKRARIEERLALAAFGNIFEFTEMLERKIEVKIGVDADGEPEFETKVVKLPLIDWDAVAASPYGAIIAGFKFSKDTAELVDFERDNALQALAQLRDMHGFKAPSRTELTGKNGQPIETTSYSDEDRVKALAMLMAKAGTREQAGA